MLTTAREYLKENKCPFYHFTLYLYFVICNKFILGVIIDILQMFIWLRSSWWRSDTLSTSRSLISMWWCYWSCIQNRYALVAGNDRSFNSVRWYISSKLRLLSRCRNELVNTGTGIFVQEISIFSNVMSLKMLQNSYSFNSHFTIIICNTRYDY